MPPKERPSRPFFDERTEPDSLRPDSPLPPPPPPRPRHTETPPTGVGLPSLVSLAIDLRELKTKVDVHNARLDRLEDRTDTTGKHDVNDLKAELRKLERKDEERQREDREREEAARAKEKADADAAKKKAADEVAAEAQRRKATRDRRLELILAALLGAAAPVCLTAIRDCSKPPAAPVVVPVQVPAAASEKP